MNVQWRRRVPCSEQPSRSRKTIGITVRGGPGVALTARTNNSPDLRKINQWMRM